MVEPGDLNPLHSLVFSIFTTLPGLPLVQQAGTCAPRQELLGALKSSPLCQGAPYLAGSAFGEGTKPCPVASRTRHGWKPSALLGSWLRYLVWLRGSKQGAEAIGVKNRLLKVVLLPGGGKSPRGYFWPGLSAVYVLQPEIGSAYCSSRAGS